MPDIREQLEAKGLGRIAGVIETAVKPSLWLATREESENGVSRLGGRPNLPEEFDWPLWQEQPLAFLAQLNLAALPAVDGLNLPREGALFFFQAAGRDEGGMACGFFTAIGPWTNRRCGSFRMNWRPSCDFADSNWPSGRWCLRFRISPIS